MREKVSLCLLVFSSSAPNRLSRDGSSVSASGGDMSRKLAWHVNHLQEAHVSSAAASLGGPGPAWLTRRKN